MPQLVPVRPRIEFDSSTGATAPEKTAAPLSNNVGLSLLTGLRRGEIFALRWGSVGEDTIKVKEAVYRGVFDAPKTPTSRRVIPLCQAALELLAEWRLAARRSGPDDLVFGTRIGKPLSPNNELRRNVYPACEELGLPRSSWLTFRRTYSSWAHDGGRPRQSHRKAHGTRQRSDHSQRVHPSDGRFNPGGRRKSGRIVQ